MGVAGGSPGDYTRGPAPAAAGRARRQTRPGAVVECKALSRIAVLMPLARHPWIALAAIYAALCAVAGVWLAIDRHPFEWDYASHLERALRCHQILAGAGPPRHSSDPRGPRELLPAPGLLRGRGAVRGAAGHASHRAARHPRLPRSGHGRGVRPGAPPGRAGRRPAGRVPVRHRALRGLLDAQLPARPAAGRAGRARPPRPGPRRRVPPRGLVARLRRGVRRGAPDQTAVPDLRGRPVRLGLRSRDAAARPSPAPGLAGGGAGAGRSDRAAVVRAPPAQHPRPGRSAAPTTMPPARARRRRSPWSR